MSNTVNEKEMPVHDSLTRIANRKYVTTLNARNDSQRMSCCPKKAH
jgi:hypothetical protein